MKHVYGAIALLLMTMQLFGANWYVDASRPDDAGDGATWSTAKRTIQAGVDAASDGDLVLVTNGVYDSGCRLPSPSATKSYSISNRVVIAKDVHVSSVNGPAVTIIKGQENKGSDVPIRCVFIASGSISGFMMTNGCAKRSYPVTNDCYGGGCYSEGGVVSNCIVTGNLADHGGGLYLETGSVFYSCTISDNQTEDGGGTGGAGGGIYMNGGALFDCIVSDNTTGWGGGYGDVGGNGGPGGGVYLNAGTLYNCLISGNRAGNGGYGHFSSGRGGHGGGLLINTGVLFNCIISENGTGYGGGTDAAGGGGYAGGGGRGGGVYGGTLKNCLIFGNYTGSSAYGYDSGDGGGAYYSELYNCTISKNRIGNGGCDGSGGGAYRSILYNSIVYGNERDDLGNSSATNTCAGDGILNGENGNIRGNPFFVEATNNDFKLLPLSPCINAGNNVYAQTNTTDLAMNSRVVFDSVDMGAYEMQNVMISPVAINGASTLTIYTTLMLPVVTNVQIVGVGNVTNITQNENLISFDSPLSTTSSIRNVILQYSDGAYIISNAFRYLGTYYVSDSNGDDANSGLNWNSPKKTIQAAVDLSYDGDVVIVTNGLYDTGTSILSGYLLSNRVIVTKNIEIRSKNGPEFTIIKGHRGTGSYAPLGPDSVRCVFMNNGLLAGFTLTDGFTKATRSTTGFYDRSGGGCYAEGALISNCVINGNMAGFYGGGVYCGWLYNCTLSDNIAKSPTGGACGGGAYDTTLYNCTFSSNEASRGGGAYAGELYQCVLSNNTATTGGGTMYSDLYNCFLKRNLSYSAGGAYAGKLYNCLLSENVAGYSGGVSGASLYNCTLVGNSASNFAGGASGGSLYNCVVWGNNAPTNSNLEVYTVEYSCSENGIVHGENHNITNAPCFMDEENSDYTLCEISPCINVGANQYAPNRVTDVAPSYDLATNPRIIENVVDMGAYEYQGPTPTPTPVPTPTPFPVEFTRIQKNSDEFQIEWTANNVATQYLEWSSSFDENWQCVFTGFPPVPRTNHISIPVDSESSKIYRIRIEQ